MAMTVLWVCIAMTTTGSDYFNMGDGYFVYQSIPMGTLVTGNTATLPDGRKVQISDQEEIEFSVRREKEEGKTPIPVQMPDGTIVDMPNKLSPELAGRLKALLNDPRAGASLAHRDQAAKQAGENKGFDLATAREVKPWEIYWSKQAGIPTTSEIRWPRFLLVGLAFPILMWISAEFLALVVRWIIRGFRESKPRPGA